MSKNVIPATIVITAVVLVLGGITAIIINNAMIAQREAAERAQQTQIDKAKCYEAADAKRIPSQNSSSTGSNGHTSFSAPVQTAYLAAAQACKSAYGPDANHPLLDEPVPR